MIAIGAPLEDREGRFSDIPNVGSVYVYRHDGQEWQEEARLGPPSDQIRGSLLMGRHIALDDDLLAVGLPNASPDGIVMVFGYQGGEWTVAETIVPAEDGRQDFGEGVAFADGRLFVGAPSEQNDQLDGAVYVYEQHGPDWIETARLSSDHPQVFRETFGSHVAASGDRVAISETRQRIVTYRLDPEADQWQREGSVPFDLDSGLGGGRIALSSEFLAIGAPLNETGGHRAGAILLYQLEEDGWSLNQTLVPEGVVHEERVGYSVAISGQNLLAGMRNTDMHPEVFTFRAPPPEPMGWDVTLAPGEDLDDLSFGKRYLPGAITGSAYRDDNRNGERDVDEVTLAGRTIYLSAASHDQLQEDRFATTDAAGDFAFYGLPPGTYEVRQLLPDDWETEAEAVMVEVQPAQVVTEVVLGSWTDPVGQVSGVLFHDLDGDGRLGDEPRLEGWQVFLDYDGDGRRSPTEPLATTDAHGAFHFDRYDYSGYQVRVVGEPGWQQMSLGTPREPHAIIERTPVYPEAGHVSQVIYDPHRRLAYLLRRGGMDVIEPGTLQIVQSLDFAGRPGGGDITADGRYLFVTERAVPVDGDEGMIYRIDLETHQVTEVPFERMDGEGGGLDLVLAADGAGFFVTHGTGGGLPSYRVLDTENLTVGEGEFSFYRNPALARSADHSRVMLSQVGITTSYGEVYDASVSDFITTRSLPDYTSIVSLGPHGEWAIVGSRLFHLTDPTQDYALDSASGRTVLDPHHRLAYSLNRSEGELRVIDTQTDQRRLTLSLPVNRVLSFEMSLSEDGNYLFVQDADHGLTVQRMYSPHGASLSSRDFGYGAAARTPDAPALTPESHTGVSDNDGLTNRNNATPDTTLTFHV